MAIKTKAVRDLKVQIPVRLPKGKKGKKKRNMLAVRLKHFTDAHNKLVVMGLNRDIPEYMWKQVHGYGDALFALSVG